MARSPLLVTPKEAANMLGKKNPEIIKAALRRGDYPIGMAYKSATGKWVYDIPRKAFEKFVQTGRVPNDYT